MEETKNQKGSSAQIDYIELFKSAFRIIWKNRFLWVLGILSGGSLYFPYNSTSFMDRMNNGASWNKHVSSQKIAEDALKWMQTNYLIVGIIAAAIVIIFLAAVLVSTISKAGLIHAVSEISRGKGTSLRSSLVFGWHKFWRVLGIGAVISLVVLLLVVVLSVIGYGLWPVKPLFVLYVLISLMMFISVTLLAGIVFEYSLRYAIIQDKRIKESFKNSFKLISEKKKDTFLIWLAVLVMSMVFGLGLVACLSFAVIVLVLLGAIFYLLAPIIAIVYAVFTVIAFVVLIFASVGFIYALASGYWTLAFNELNK